MWPLIALTDRKRGLKPQNRSGAITLSTPAAAALLISPSVLLHISAMMAPPSGRDLCVHLYHSSKNSGIRLTLGGAWGWFEWIPARASAKILFCIQTEGVNKPDEEGRAEGGGRRSAGVDVLLRRRYRTSWACLPSAWLCNFLIC